MSQSPAFLSKIVAPDQAVSTASSLQSPWVMTNGVFDVLHVGHVTYLANAKSLGMSLVVVINTDASVKRLGKGDDRPINQLSDRLVMLAALESVDLVTWFDEDTPVSLIEQLRPMLWVKGGDYDVSVLPEATCMAAWGGRALSLPFVDGYSTTTFVQKVRGTI